MFLCLLLLSALPPLISAQKGKMMIEPNMGRKCARGEQGETPGIRWYMDFARMTAYPYFYYGCGSSHTLKTKQSAMPLDGSFCPGFVTNGTCYTDHRTGMEVKCQAGYFCEDGYMVGTCCQQSTADAYNYESSAPRCPNSAVTINPYGHWDEILLGRTCEHSFCPPRSRCVQGEFIAYCCKH